MKKKPSSENIAIKIGADQAAVVSVQAAINDILSAPFVDNKTKRAALKALESSCSVGDTSISGCSIQMGGE